MWRGVEEGKERERQGERERERETLSCNSVTLVYTQDAIVFTRKAGLALVLGSC
jgi:hypothetical protein